jgi:hypothetical protein
VTIVGQSRLWRVYSIAHAASCMPAFACWLWRDRLRRRQIQLESARVRERIDRLTETVSGVRVVIGCAPANILRRVCDAFAKLRCQTWREPDRQTGADEHACRKSENEAVWLRGLCM